MFDLSFPEFFIAALVALAVLGPQRLPAALRTLGLWLGRFRRAYYNVKTEVEREIGMDEVRRQLHNEQVMADVKRVEREVRAMGREVEGDAAIAETPAAAADASPPEAVDAAPAQAVDAAACDATAEGAAPRA